MAILKILKSKKTSSKDSKEVKNVKKETQKSVISSTSSQASNSRPLPRYYVTKPWISEKAAFMTELNQYFFAVTDDANKNIVKKEIENRYHVKVSRVNMLIKKPKIKKLGFLSGKSKGFKKAIVTLMPGHKIEII